MTKYFCDRCGKECMELTEISIPREKTRFGSFTTKGFQVCADCEKEYNVLNEKLVDIRFIMFSDFMKGDEPKKDVGK